MSEKGVIFDEHSRRALDILNQEMRVAFRQLQKNLEGNMNPIEILNEPFYNEQINIIDRGKLDFDLHILAVLIEKETQVLMSKKMKKYVQL